MLLCGASEFNLSEDFIFLTSESSMILLSSPWNSSMLLTFTEKRKSLYRKAKICSMMYVHTRFQKKNIDTATLD